MLSERTVVQFSGGKDSTALMYLLRDQLADMTVLFGDTGEVFPHVRRFVEETCGRLGAKLLIVRPAQSVASYMEERGLPADIVPVEASILRPIGGGTALQPYTSCCSAMLWEPLARAIRQLGATAVYRGSKKSDSRVGVPDGHVEDGVTYKSPLWNWTDADVMAFLDREGVALPAHYAAVNQSMDCFGCSAHLAHHGAAKLRWMREHTPDLYTIAADRIRRVKAALLPHLATVGDAMKEAEAP